MEDGHIFILRGFWISRQQAARNPQDYSKCALPVFRFAANMQGAGSLAAGIAI